MNDKEVPHCNNINTHVTHILNTMTTLETYRVLVRNQLSDAMIYQCSHQPVYTDYSIFTHHTVVKKDCHVQVRV